MARTTDVQPREMARDKAIIPIVPWITQAVAAGYASTSFKHADCATEDDSSLSLDPSSRIARSGGLAAILGALFPWYN